AIPQINFRINGEGGADIYDLVAPVGWRNIFPAGTFEHSEVVDGVFQNPTVYYIQFDGDYSSEDPHYSVAVWKVGQSEPIAVSSTIRYWQYQPPSAGSGIVMLQFPGAGTNAPYAVDDIHLVEVGAAPEGYAVWAEGFFSAEELEDDSISGPRADADGDGLANLLEY